MSNESEKLKILIEAVCEFRYTSENQWNNTYPGLLFAEIKDEYSIIESDVLRDLVFEFKEDGSGSSQVERRFPRSKFRKPDNSGIVTLSEHKLSISSLKPYAGWEKFQKEILRIYNIYDDIVTKNDVLIRIGLRYINVIKETEGMQLLSYIKFNPLDKSIVNEDPEGFVFQADYPISYETPTQISQGRIRINLTKRKVPNESLVIDIDAMYDEPLLLVDPEAHPASIQEEDIKMLLIELHSSVKNIFGGIISNNALDEFDIDLSEE